jgi:N6-adenosine-specific RNA methylase IME4
LIYRTIFADPPWAVKAGTLKGAFRWGDSQGAPKELPYPSMSVEQIAALNVGAIAHPEGAHLYLATINRYVPDAYTVARAWGFEPSTLLVWAKTTMGGGLGGTYGISTEYVLFCRRGKCAANRREPRTWFSWKRPYDERGKPRHSAKPPELYRLIEEVSPGPHVELFARCEREGWDRWGNEVKSTPAVSFAMVHSMKQADLEDE